MPTTVRISERAYERLRRLSEIEGLSIIETLDKMTREWEKMRFFKELNEGFAALRADELGWNEEQQERMEWDRTLLDDLGQEDDIAETE